MKTFLIADTPIQAIFDYKDGELYWKISPVNWINEGELVGSTRHDGYKETQFRNVKYLVHRLIFFYHHGYWPKLIDHRDRNPSNNKIENLRESNKSLNAYNYGLPVNNKSGVRGVSWDKTRNKWVARFKQGTKYLWLGYFDTIEAATAVRQSFEKGGISENISNS